MEFKNKYFIRQSAAVRSYIRYYTVFLIAALSAVGLIYSGVDTLSVVSVVCASIIFLMILYAAIKVRGDIAKNITTKILFDEDGFTITGGGKDKRYLWSQAVSYDVIDLAGGYSKAFELTIKKEDSEQEEKVVIQNSVGIYYNMNKYYLKRGEEITDAKKLYLANKKRNRILYTIMTVYYVVTYIIIFMIFALIIYPGIVPLSTIVYIFLALVILPAAALWAFLSTKLKCGYILNTEGVKDVKGREYVLSWEDVDEAHYFKDEDLSGKTEYLTVKFSETDKLKYTSLVIDISRKLKDELSYSLAKVMKKSTQESYF